MKNVSKILGYEPTIYIGDGHGEETAGKRTPWIPGVGQIRENSFNKPVADMFERVAKAAGFRVVQIAPESSDVGLRTRTNRVNEDFRKQRKANPTVSGQLIGIGISVHFNAFNGKFDGKKGGISVFHSQYSPNGKRLAGLLLTNLLHGYDQVSRGIKKNNLHMTRETDPVFCLVECGFMDKIEEAKKMLLPAFQLETAMEILAGCFEYYGIDPADMLEDDADLTPILSPATATVSQAQAWAKSKGAAPYFVALVPVFWSVAEVVGVNPVGTFVQSCKETGYGKFGGVLDASYCNPCGLKTKAGGGNYDPSAHKKFNGWGEGIQAMVDHEALYAGAPGYPRSNSPDPRHFSWINGVAPNWEDLSGRWAPSKTYGQSIVKMMKELESTVVEVLMDPVPAYLAQIDKLEKQLALMTVRTDQAETTISGVRALVYKEV